MAAPYIEHGGKPYFKEGTYGTSAQVQAMAYYYRKHGYRTLWKRRRNGYCLYLTL